MQLALYFDQTRCTGCCACIVACKDWNSLPPGPGSWVNLVTIQRGKYPDLFLAFMLALCHHCAEPACVAACPQGGITKRTQDGIVVLDTDACIGRDSCGDCLEACPYEAIRFGTEENPGAQKCDFCLERWSQGKPPICVASCPMRALDAGPLDELEAKYGSIRAAEGFEHNDKLRPSVLFKPKFVHTG